MIRRERERETDFVQKVFQQWTGFQETSNAKNLKVRECTAIEAWKTVQRRANGQHEFEFEDRSTDVILKAQREDFKQSFQIEEQREHHLNQVHSTLPAKSRQVLPRSCGRDRDSDDRCARCACDESSQ